MKIEITNGAETPVAEFFSSPSSTPETHGIFRNAKIADHPPARLAATLIVKCEKLERERDEARELAKEADLAHDMAISDLQKCEAELDTLAVENMLDVHQVCKERDKCKMQLKVMQAERDVARISARKSYEAHDRVIGDLERADVVAEKAKELIARWDQPSWKDTAPTAGFINALRNAVEAYEGRLK